MTADLVLMIAGLVLFALASANVGGPINLTAAGLACVTLAMLLSGGI